MLKIIVFVMILLTSSISVNAQQTNFGFRPVCTDRDTILSNLSTEYSEAPVAMGIANNGGVIEILSSASGKSWTIILTMPNGMTCMIAAGESWEFLPKQDSLGPLA